MTSPISIVIPYEHHPLRLPLLAACVKSLSRNPQCEICIVETGPEAYIQDHIDTVRKWTSGTLKYLKVFTFHPFNRAWALNVGVRKLATHKHILLSDADLLFPANYKDVLLKTKPPAIAWSCIFYLSKKSTDRFLKTSELVRSYIRTAKPEKHNAAGGAAWVTKSIMEEVKGMPEKDFYGKYGEDNAFWMKLESFGYKIEKADMTLYHLYHPETSATVNPKRFIVWGMRSWTKAQWLKYQHNWGEVATSFGTQL